MLTTPELLHLRKVPCDSGVQFGDSRVLLELCRAATMAANFRTEWGEEEDRPSVVVAAEAVFNAVRSYGMQGFQTLDSLIFIILWELSGRMYVEPADRATYGMAVKASLHAGVSGIHRGDERFTYLMQQAEAFIAEGMEANIAQHELNELACLLYQGISVADFKAEELSRQERERAEDFRRGIHIVSENTPEGLAEALGISTQEAEALLSYEITSLG
jgi:hypothetical protein